jgi:hypothetical protein
MCGLSVYGYLNGDPMLLLTTWDYDGNGCGYNKTTMDYPYLYFVAPDVSNLTTLSTDPLKAFSYTACVKTCPKDQAAVFCKEPSFFTGNIKFKNCEYFPAAYQMGNGDIIYGPSLKYDSQLSNKFEFNLFLVLDKYCIPDAASLKSIANASLTTFKDTFLSKFNVDKYSDYITDLYKVWVVEAICVGVAFGWGFLFMILIRCCAGVIVWLSIFFIECCLGGGGYWAYITKDKYDMADPNYNYLMYGAYVLWAIAGLFLIIILCLCSRIRLGVAIAKVTGQFIYNTP